MFIKKDLRKIPKILEDAPECSTTTSFARSPTVAVETPPDLLREQPSKRFKQEKPLKDLKLGRRKVELNGNLQILCQPKYLSKLGQLQSINLYDCGLITTDGIGVLGDCPNLHTNNLGRNPLKELSDDISKLANSLKHVWLDDCQLTGPLPSSLLQLTKLETLRMPNNKINDISKISQLTNLKLLCLDKNQITELPDPFEEEQFGGTILPNAKNDDDDDTDMAIRTTPFLPNLEELYLRHNELTSIPTQFFKSMTKLRIVHLSSNQLTDDENCWPALTSCCLKNGSSSSITTLTTMYLNGNQFSSISEDFLLAVKNNGNKKDDSKKLRVVISHNPITKVPDVFWDMVGKSDDNDEDFDYDDTIMNDDDENSSSNNYEIVWQPNSNLTRPTTSEIQEAATAAVVVEGDVEMTSTATD